MSDFLWYFVLPAFSSVSVIYLIRKLREYQWGWVKAKYSLKNKVFIITGANTGLSF